jgi:hypothetical protein
MIAGDNRSATTADNDDNDVVMPAGQLRAYMAQLEAARATSATDALDQATEARQRLIRHCLQPVEITPERLARHAASVRRRLQEAARNGQTELLLAQFPVELSTDHGRAVNNGDPDWPDTLVGRPRQAIEFWRSHLHPLGYRLAAMIVEWPHGLPGDIGLFLRW